ncbi:hypothetical protein [Hymenobacter psychrophilus]|uniref:Uncharacterized protein n=1 Tax=Hymenobacter psychrophilus TaxID=651662 RepID=A0A1H3H2V2_9BACT|nr:hypothetical protein [Hymenobacter psychrophilus]SDY09555.1 hypothetical protein SAMN04488069_105266 [Hymenobacter psychrophilus]
MKSEQWTTNWVIDKLTGHNRIFSIKKDNENDLILIERNFGENIIVATLSLSEINISSVVDIITNKKLDFIVNVKKDYIVKEDAYQLATQHKVIIGGMGDIDRIMNQEYNWPYLDPETNFIIRGLEQHTKVRSINKIDNRRLKLSTINNNYLIIIYLNDYDLSIESVRKSIREYNSFDCILKSNPNGRISSDAVELASSLNIKLLTWGELLRELNFIWKQQI